RGRGVRRLRRPPRNRTPDQPRRALRVLRHPPPRPRRMVRDQSPEPANRRAHHRMLPRPGHGPVAAQTGGGRLAALPRRQDGVEPHLHRAQRGAEHPRR
ncbi:hypothetical protein LTS01_026033, partial [Friedmanniomyces endolithicus]